MLLLTFLLSPFFQPDIFLSSLSEFRNQSANIVEASIAFISSVFLRGDQSLRRVTIIIAQMSVIKYK